MQNFSFCGDGCSFWYLFLNEPILPGGERAKRASPNPRREQPVHLTFWLFRLLNFHPAQDRSYYYSIGPSSDFDSHEQSNHICHCQGGWFDLLGELFLRSPDLSLEGSLGLGTACLALQLISSTAPISIIRSHAPSLVVSRILAMTTAFLCAAIISFTVGNNLLLSCVRLRSFASIFFVVVKWSEWSEWVSEWSEWVKWIQKGP